jgi:predicted nucleotidyltransferase
MDVDRLVETLAAVLARHGGVRLAFLFGSRATGRARPDSDVDLAFLPADPALSLWDEGLLQHALEQALGLPVDLVRLDGAGPVLRWQVARDGKLVHADRQETAVRWRASAASEHADDGERIEAAARTYLARVGGT